MRALVEAHPPRGEVQAALGLGRGSGRVKALFALARRSPLTVGEIADELCVDAPYATLIVNHLEGAELVVRTPDPADRRRKLVSPTAAGRTAMARARRITDRPPPTFARLRPEEVAQLHALLARLDSDGEGHDRPAPGTSPSGRSAE